MLRGQRTSQETAERLKTKLSREDDTKHLTRHTRPTRMTRSCRLADGARVALKRTPTGNARKQSSEFRSVGDLAKSDKKKKRWMSTMMHLSLLLSLIRSANRRTTSACSQAGRTAWQTRTLWYNGDIKKKNPRQQFRPEKCSKHISIISDRRIYLTSSTNELNDKQGKKIKKKKSKWLCNSHLGSG